MKKKKKKWKKIIASITAIADKNIISVFCVSGVLSCSN